MKKLSFLMMMFSLISFSLISCGDDDDGGNIYTGPNCYSSWANAYSQSIQQMSQAAQNYAMDQTTANCNAYKDAYQQFLNDVKPYQNCGAIPTTERQEFIEQIEEAEEDIDDLC